MIPFFQNNISNCWAIYYFSTIGYSSTTQNCELTLDSTTAGSDSFWGGWDLTLTKVTLSKVEKGISLKRGATILNSVKSRVNPLSASSFKSLNAQGGGGGNLLFALKVANSSLGYLGRGVSLSVSHEGSSDIDWYLKIMYKVSFTWLHLVNWKLLVRLLSGGIRNRTGWKCPQYYHFSSNLCKFMTIKTYVS